MADANAIYHSSLIIYYSSTLFVLFDHHYYYTDHLSLFNFIFSSHISLLMADANAIYHFSLIICYSWTEHIITHQVLFFLFFVDAMFISSFFISSYFRSVWHPFSCFILRMVYFFICVTSLGSTHFPSCSSHTVKNLFSKFLHPEYGSQCCKYTLTEPPAPKIHVHTPSTANAFWGHLIED